MDITEQYLENLYDTLHREQLKTLHDIKSGCSNVKSNDCNKQISLLTSIMVNVLKLRNLNRKISGGEQ